MNKWIVIGVLSLCVVGYASYHLNPRDEPQPPPFSVLQDDSPFHTWFPDGEGVNPRDPELGSSEAWVHRARYDLQEGPLLLEGEVPARTRWSLTLYQEDLRDFFVAQRTLGSGGRYRFILAHSRDMKGLGRSRSSQHRWVESPTRHGHVAIQFDATHGKGLDTEAVEELRRIQGRDRIRRLPPVPAAIAAYLRGRDRWQSRSRDGLSASLQDFEEALSLAPEFALAWAGLADSACLLGLYSIVAPGEVMPRAKEAALQALELDPNLAEAHASLGLVRYLHDWDFQGGEESFLRAMELDPTYATVRHWYAMLLMATGRHLEATRAMEGALEADQEARLLQVKFGTILTAAGDFQRAGELLARNLERYPDYAMAHREMGFFQLKQGRLEEALEAFQRAAELSGGEAKSTGGLGHVYAVLGRTADAQRVLRELEAAHRPGYLPPMYLALIYAGLDDRDGAFEWLSKAEELRDPGLVYLRVKPGLDRLAHDPRFAELTDRMGLTGN